MREADGSPSRLDPGLPLVVADRPAGELDRVRGFERGADDFVCKPFSYGELRARMAALLRRARERPRRAGACASATLEIDPPSREVRLRGARVELSQKEFALLRALAAEPTRVFTKEELLRDVWGFRSMGATRTLDSHACRLRQKLGAAGDRFVVNVWGVGYRLVDGPVARTPRARRPPRMGERGVTAALAVAGWAAALGALGAAAGLRASPGAAAELVAEAAHELRGPLGAALLGLHGVVADEAGRGASPPSSSSCAAPGSRSTTSTPRRAGGARPTRRAVDVGALLAEAVEAWRPLARAFGAELLVDAARGRACSSARDRLRLAQAVGNLVANALEHGAGPVRIRVRPRGRTRADRGPRPRPGPARAGRRAHGRRLHAGRRGHGLAIAARVGRRHGGRLLTAPVSSGACVALELPRAARAVVPASAPATVGRAPARGASCSASRSLLGGLAASDVARREAALREQLGPVLAGRRRERRPRRRPPADRRRPGAAPGAAPLRAGRRRRAPRRARRSAARRARPARRLPRRGAARDRRRRRAARR